MSAALPRWQALWLIGWERRREGEEPQPDPPEQLAHWRKEGADAEQRVLLRAQARLGERAGQLAPALRRARWALGAVCALIALAGGAGVFTLLGPGERPVNVIWTWLALLGPHLVMLALWLAGLSMGGGAPWSGRSLAALGQRIPGLVPDRAAIEALWDGLRQSGAGRWALSVLSHLLWLSALAGALLGLLLALSLRRYGFTWETTILPAAWFESLVMTLAWLPGLVGLPQPDAGLVAASGEGPVASDLARRSWSFWLVGGLVVYGILPRLVALIVCRWRLQRAVQRLQLPWQQPYYAVLQRRLAPRSTRLGVVDADSVGDSVEQWVMGGVGAGAAVIGLDVPADWPWPPVPGTSRDHGRCESREQRAAALQALTDQPAERLLVVVEAAQSPDRGTLRFIGELAGHCRALALLLAGPDRDRRRDLWRDAAGRRGLDGAVLFVDAEPAARWLSGGAS
ncbi:DUF2868 domain-containing protein [Pseudomarimonas salicorniae]|uniref:DUF2868 domain-containing protein n=1 Tax=Pseudomarimonas salicorniae TaxID=2933270 RepID=A0ABT0GGF5_9GAMM|nr:DUF2868 domain-containing protein [Lysobacter sp. CAU 1642]MCK7593432.1 DUF2868 domain-containing protein [Lysobacter sp. CAU 1642]